MKAIFLIIFLLLATGSFCQTSSSISVIDLVKIKNGYRLETLFYYEKNWKLYREKALEKGYIKSYKLFEMTADTTNSFDLILITEYADSLQFSKREEHFQPLIKEIRPNGPILLNAIKPNDFRQSIFSKQAHVLYCSEKIQAE